MEAIVNWVSSSPRLCLTPLTLNLQPLLPKGSIVMTSVTPLAGLFRWCIESPLYPEPEKPTIKSETIKKEAAKTVQPHSPPYSKLHCSLLESMLERNTLQSQQQLLQSEVISPRHLVAVVRCLQDSCAKNTSKTDQIQLALDRLAQAVQIAHASGCLYGNTRKHS